MNRTLLLRNGWFVNKIDFGCERSCLLNLSTDRFLRGMVTVVASCSRSDLGIHWGFFLTLHRCVYVTARAILIEIKIELRVFNFCGWFELIVASAARALLKLVPRLLRCHTGKVFPHSIVLFGFFSISPDAPNVIVHSNGTASWLLTFTLFVKHVPGWGSGGFPGLLEVRFAPAPIRLGRFYAQRTVAISWAGMVNDYARCLVLQWLGRVSPRERSLSISQVRDSAWRLFQDGLHWFHLVLLTF